MSKRAINLSELKRQHRLNPIFHLQTKNDDSSVLSMGMIKQARKSGILNLSGRGLVSVPDRVFNLHEPQDNEIDIKFDANKTRDDDEDVWWNQKALTSLDLSSNSLSIISNALQNLTELTVLNLQDNLLTSLPDGIGSLEKLTKLNLSRNKLKILPKSFFRLKELRQINLSNNIFTEIDPDISDLVMLETMDISHNQLTSLPGGIGFLVRLNHLTLSHNKLKELPSDIVNLRSLNKLDLIHNDIESLPKYMGELRKLECLYVQHNDIKELPEFIGCDALKEIHISNNYIKEISIDFCESLPQLRTLDLRDNKIEKIPDEIAMLQSLMRLDLSNNSINSLPSSLSTLAHLVSLQLEGNPIRSLRRDILQGGTTRIMKTLKQRSQDIKPENVTSNLLSSQQQFPDKFQMSKTHALALGMKELTDVPESVFIDAQDAGVSNVDISKNKLTRIPDGIEHLSQSLSELSLNNNLLSTLPKFFAQFTKIQYINISSNQFSDLPNEFGVLVSLRELNIANNQFKRIPDCVYDLKKLEILMARDNKISELDASENGLGGLPRLTVLCVANNDLEHIPPILGNLKNIKSLELSGNRFRQPRHQIIEKGTDAIMSYLRDRIPQ